MQTMREDSLKRKSEVNLKMNFAASRFERCSRRRARIRMLRARRTSTPAVNHESLCEPRIALAPQSIARAHDSRWPETALSVAKGVCRYLRVAVRSPIPIWTTKSRSNFKRDHPAPFGEGRVVKSVYS